MALPDGSAPDPLSAALSALASAAHALAAVAAALRNPSASPLSPSPPSFDPQNAIPTQFQRNPDACNAPSFTVCGVSLVAAVNEFLTSKARAGRSDRYLRQLRVVLSSLVAGRSQTPIEQVSASDVDRWLRGRGWGDRTRRGYLSDASTFFAWSIRRGWIRENPAKGVDVPRGVSAPPGILTPGQVRELLCDAAAADVGVARVLALRLFAGVRTAESLRLREVDLLGGFVRVEASASKTRRRRLVPIRPNLAAWLALSGGELPVSEKRMRRVLTGRELPSNAARHSFVSYHLAEFGNAGRTALEAGHGEQVLFNHYRELVTPESAREFWGIMPQPAPQGPP